MAFLSVWLLLVTIIFILFIKMLSIRNHWSHLGVQTSAKKFATMFKVVTSRISLGEAIRDVYKEFKRRGLRFGGCLVPFPVLIIVDPELVKRILQKDFEHFMSKGLYYNESDDPIKAHLVVLDGQRWRNLRTKLTPTFTSGKMKMMFSTLVQASEHLAQVLEKVEDCAEMEIKDLMARLNTDIIGSCAFGIDCNSLADPDTEFRKYGRLMLTNTVWLHSKRLFANAFPRFAKLFGVRLTVKSVSQFFTKTIEETVKYREQNRIYRRDFMHSMIQLKNRGEVTDDKDLGYPSSLANSDNKLTMNEIAANAFVFFIAGFETASSTMSYALFELSRNQDIQDKLRHEIERVLGKYDGEITYDGIMEMGYLSKVISETLRKYPTVPFLPRLCNSDYKIPGEDVILPRGTKVYVSVEGLHHDPEFYPNPSDFDPERFNEGNKLERHPFVYLPFGEGPRICIGMRFGLMQVKVGLAYLLKGYIVSSNPRTSVPLVRDPKIALNVTIGGIWINLRRIKKTES